MINNDVFAKKGLFDFSKLKVIARPSSTISLSLTTTKTIKYKNEVLDANDYKLNTRLLAEEEEAPLKEDP